MSFLSDTDHELAELVEAEVTRQRKGLEMIASENFVSPAVLEALGSPLTNKYSEGYPGKRYYGGNQIIDQIEQLAIERAKKLFGAEHANVQPHAGSQANMAAYFALLKPGDTILAMSLAEGGHLTHGSPVNFSGQLYNIVPYGVSPDTELIDMDAVRAIALKEKPKLIIAGFTVYPRHLDFARFRAIAEEVGAYLMVDMAHFAGLVAAKVHPDPLPYADVVTTTTHKTLRGPRGGMILSKIEDRLVTKRSATAKTKTLAQRIDSAVFPGLQGGPLEHVIAAKAVCFKEAMRPEFVTYQKQVLKNAAVLAEALADRGLRIITGGTDNHLIFIDLTPLNLTGKEAQDALDRVDIATNKNMIPNDPRSPMDPSGLRIGTPALTSRGFMENEMDTIAGLMNDILRDRDSEATRTRVQQAVHTLSAEHPLYPAYTAL